MQTSLNWLMYNQHSYCFIIILSLASVRQGRNLISFYRISQSPFKPQPFGPQTSITSPKKPHLITLTHRLSSLALIHFRHLMKHCYSLIVLAKSIRMVRYFLTQQIFCIQMHFSVKRPRRSNVHISVMWPLLKSFC